MVPQAEPPVREGLSRLLYIIIYHGHCSKTHQLVCFQMVRCNRHFTDPPSFFYRHAIPGYFFRLPDQNVLDSVKTFGFLVWFDVPIWFQWLKHVSFHGFSQIRYVAVTKADRLGDLFQIYFASVEVVMQKYSSIKYLCRVRQRVKLKADLVIESCLQIVDEQLSEYGAKENLISSFLNDPVFSFFYRLFGQFEQPAVDVHPVELFPVSGAFQPYRQFGVDFESGEVGLVDWDRNCRTVFDLISVLDLGFWPQMTGWLEIWVGKESGSWAGCRDTVHWYLDSSVIEVRVKTPRKYTKLQYIKVMRKLSVGVQFLILTCFHFIDYICL